MGPRGHLPPLGRSFLGLRPADGGTYRHYDAGLEHLAFQVDSRDEVDEAYQRCISAGSAIESPPQEHYVDVEREDYYAFFVFDPSEQSVNDLDMTCELLDESGKAVSERWVYYWKKTH